MKTLLERKISLVVIILQFLVSLLVCIYFGTTGLVPVKYMVAIAVVMVVLLVYQVMSQLTNSSYIFGRVLAVLFCAVFLVGANYVRESMAAFQNVGGATKKVDVISFYVMKDDAAKTLADAKNYSFGILRQQDRENTDKAVQDASKKLNKTLNTVEYDDPLTMVDALYAKEVQAIIMNKSFVDTVKSQYKTFSTDTRELDASKIESEVEELVDTDVTTKPFNVYISGIDVYGKIGQTSRSDVNIIATVNPVTKKVLLTSTPRDYYVPLYSKGGKSYSGGIPDKLTHAGIYGVDCSINTLEKLYNIDIDYYVRVNFTSLKKIVDLLGGVEVYSDYDFISDWGPHGAGTHYKFKKGYNKVNGKKALAFCRERHHFANGDYQRGRDHQHMIEAILNKVMSPSVLPNFSSLLKESKSMFQTSMSKDKIVSLCNMQLNDMAKWKIAYANAEGTGAKKTTFSIRSTALYVCEPNYNSVKKITKRMKKVMKETKEFPIKIFINNAGFGACGDFTDTDAATELQMIDVNVKAMHLLMKLMLKKMEKQENQGYILNVASSAGLLPAGPFMATYYATKAYMVSLTRAVAAEQRSKRSRIYVGALCPGPVDTEFNDVAKVKFALPGITPQYCASYALEQMRKRKTIIVPKFTIRAATTMARFVPQKMLIPVIGQLQKKKF